MRLAALAVLFVLCAGCAGLHGDRTVTSDVTGVWVGEWVSRGGQMSPATLRLEQTGSTVTGRMEQAGTFAGPLQGSIVGIRLRYHAVDGSWGAEFTVAGDVMSGYGSLTRWRGTFRRDAPER